MRNLDDIRCLYPVINQTTQIGDYNFDMRFKHYRWLVLRILRLEKALMYYANFLEEDPLVLPKMSPMTDYGFGAIARKILSEDF